MKLPLFSCFNPACCRGFSTRRGVENHMHQNVICAKYAAVTILYVSSDESDLDTDNNSPEVVEENTNILDNNDNFSIGIDDDDDDDNNNSELKKTISELYKKSEINEDGTFPISKDHLVYIMTPVGLPPRINFQFSLLYLLSHLSIPLYIYFEVICMINEMINQNKNNNSSQFETPFSTSCKSILKQISKNPLGTPIRVLPYPTKQGDKYQPIVAFDVISIVREEVQNPTLWFHFFCNDTRIMMEKICSNI